jgi:hypothetical protein
MCIISLSMTLPVHKSEKKSRIEKHWLTMLFIGYEKHVLNNIQIIHYFSLYFMFHSALPGATIQAWLLKAVSSGELNVEDSLKYKDWRYEKGSNPQ